MLSLEDVIKHNLETDFEVLSDFCFYRAEELYLYHPTLGHAPRVYKPKILRSDQDGVWEESLQLCDSVLEEMAKENKGIKENYELAKEIFYKPLEKQEAEMNLLYQSCNLKLPEFLQANYRAYRKFRFAKNSLSFVNAAEKLGYYFYIYSGSPKVAIQVHKDHKIIYPLALELIWKKIIGLQNEQIKGSEYYFDEKRRFLKVNLLLEHKKGEEVRKELYEPLIYFLIFTDDLYSDDSLMACGLDILPIVFVTKKKAKGLSGIRISCTDKEKDMMQHLKTILKVERGVMQYLGRIDVKNAKLTARKIKDLFEICSFGNEKFLSYREAYVNEYLQFLNQLTLKTPDRAYHLFPEKLTRIKTYLKMLKHIKDIRKGKELLNKTFDIGKKYSAEVPKG